MHGTLLKNNAWDTVKNTMHGTLLKNNAWVIVKKTMNGTLLKKSFKKVAYIDI